MNRIARFEKVSKEKFFEGWKDTFETAEEKEMEAIYESLKLPGRATAGSAGYDFFAPAAAWTLHGEKDVKAARRSFDMYIFEMS